MDLETLDRDYEEILAELLRVYSGRPMCGGPVEEEDGDALSS
jgi:hypothetical protein